jgi:hypothetical protein
VLPQYDPQIVGVYPNYKLNDFVVVNCTSDMSSPPPNVYWYINDVLVSIKEILDIANSVG